MKRFFVIDATIWLLVAGQLWLPSRTFAEPRRFVGQEQHVKPTALDQVRDIIFNIDDKILRFKDKKFVLVLRFTKTTRKPDSQIVITRFDDDRTEILIEQLPRPLSAYFPDDISEESLTRDRLQALARVIRMERTILRQAPDKFEQLLSQFLKLKFPPMPDEGLPIDGTQYDLWYACPQQTIHVTQYGPVVGSSGITDQPVKWMNQVYKVLGRHDLPQVKRS